MPSSQDPAPTDLVPPDVWAHLRLHTRARIALGRSGGSLPTRETLSFALDHAIAQDAVVAEFDPGVIQREIDQPGLQFLALESAAESRATYVARPDLGRRLSEDSARRAQALGSQGRGFDLVIIVSDGLSPRAAHEQVPALFREMVPRLRHLGFRLAPVCFVRNGRVGLQDELGSLMRAAMALTLLGERPGLAVADSLGAYLIYGPRPGRTDADRNCVSNIRQAGLVPAVAAERIVSLLNSARRRAVSGVTIKEEDSPIPSLDPQGKREIS